MGKKEKLKLKLLSKPKDFTWDELKTLLKGYGYIVIKGKGSRRKFYLKSPRSVILLHKPHPGNVVKYYVLKEVVSTLKNIGVINEHNEV